MKDGDERDMRDESPSQQRLSRALVSFVKFKHPRTIMHPILTVVLDLLWENLVS